MPITNYSELKELDLHLSSFGNDFGGFTYPQSLVTLKLENVE
jgi:hypothetical protein